jgi:N6-L-threonylcarbamoyladenine synthase
VRVLGIESSCDETAAAVYDVSAGLLSSVVSSQVAVHGAYGGVVPELASREHLKSIVPVVEKALSDASTGRDAIDGIAVTAGPGLIGSLLVGLCFAKSLAFAWGKPLYGADHLEAHVYAVFLESDVPFPYIALLVSGGHTSLFRVEGWGEMKFLGGTRDDAAGEAFDKAAKMMGLPYPGGVAIDRAGQEGDPARFHFPRAWLSRDSADFSFSGLKTALRTFLASPQGKAARVEDVASSFQEAVADVLVGKAIEAAERERVPRLVLAGGVSANSRLRTLAQRRGAAAAQRVNREAA